MSIGKKYPMNVRALRIVTFELLRDLVNENTTQEDMSKSLKDLSDRSMLAEHWITSLIEPVFLMMKYVRAEREGEFGLHLYCCHEMIPYFFAAGHWNYAHDRIIYLRTMQRMPTKLLKKFMKGEHVIRLTDGSFNGIWSDMAIELTYMRVGKGKYIFYYNQRSTNHNNIFLYCINKELKLLSLYFRVLIKLSRLVQMFHPSW